MKISFAEKQKFKSKSFFNVSLSNGMAQESRVVLCGAQKTIEIKIPGKKKLNWRQATIIPRKIIFVAKQQGIKKIALDWKEIEKLDLGAERDVAESFGVNFEMADYEFVRYRTTPEGGWNFIEEVCVIVDDADIKSAFKKGQLIGQETNACRELSNMPGGDMTPSILVQETKKAIRGTDAKMKVLEESDMRKLGMNSVLSVAKGSKEKPKFIIIEYAGTGKSNKPIVFVGKGVTFDSGGLNIKPGDSMLTMNMDMSGGAAVIRAVILASKLRISRRVVGLVPVVESMPSGESLRPGDVIKSMSGKTIEVQNTDAEGRIILADANTFAERYKPELVVNVATLTGAASVALGERASALLTKDEKISDMFRELGEKSGDYVWPLPLWDEYEEEIKGIVGDVCNIRNRQSTRDGGTILGAMFIYQFAKKFKLWVHIDIAPRMTAVYDEFLSQGAAGAPVRLLIKLLERY